MAIVAIVAALVLSAYWCVRIDIRSTGRPTTATKMTCMAATLVVLNSLMLQSEGSRFVEQVHRDSQERSTWRSLHPLEPLSSMPNQLNRAKPRLITYAWTPTITWALVGAVLLFQSKQAVRSRGISGGSIAMVLCFLLNAMANLFICYAGP